MSNLPIDIAREKVTDQFINQLAQQYDFDPTVTNLKEELTEIIFRHFIFEGFSDEGDYAKERRKEIKALKTSLVKTLNQIEKLDGSELGLEISHGLRILGEEANKNLPDLSPPEGHSQKSWRYTVFRTLCNGLSHGLDAWNENLKHIGGRPKDLALQNSIRLISDFWRYNLNRKYTLDYQGSEGLTQAFAFTKTILNHFLAIEDQRIITAMRAEIKEERAYEKRTSGNNLDDFSD